MDLQLELNLENKSPEEARLCLMQRQIDQAHESMGKVRRKLFSEVGELKKLFVELRLENENLKATLKELQYAKREWSYGQNGYLFDVSEYQEAYG